MASGKVTGTEQARFDRPKAGQSQLPATAESVMRQFRVPAYLDKGKNIIQYRIGIYNP